VELAEQINHGAPRLDAVVISVYSSGSQAGLLMGKQLARLPADHGGVPRGESVRRHVGAPIPAPVRRFGFAIEVPKSIHLLDGYQGSGRAAVGQPELDAIVRLARSEGVILAPGYTAKAFAGLIDTLRRDPRALGHRVCFIHTGGIFSLFPFRESLTRL